MSFQTINTKTNAIQCDKKNKVIEGHLVKVETGVGQYKSNIYHLRQRDGTEVTVWGGTAIDGALTNGEKGRKCVVNESYKGVLIRFTWKGERKGKKGQNPFQDIQVQVDLNKKLKEKLPF